MSWSIYNAAQARLRAGDPQDALRIMAVPEAATGENWSFFACLEAECHVAAGAPQAAQAVLERATARGTDNHWVYHGLANLHRARGDHAGAVEATRVAHALLGWPESQRHGYTFSHDYFSANIPDWTVWFAGWITAAPIDCLEIGSWQGGSATWLLDRVVGPRGGTLTCIDTFEGSSEHASVLASIGRPLAAVFGDNIARTGRASQCRTLVGRSQDVLRQLHAERFDFIYVDGAHEAKYLIQDAVLAWALLRDGGFLLFDDINYRFAQQPEQDSRTAVDAFRIWFADEIEAPVPATDRQMLLRKRGGS